MDTKKGMLYYIPTEDQDMDELEVIAPTVKHIFEIEGTPDNIVTGVCIRGLELISTKGDFKHTEENGEILASDAQSQFHGHGAIRLENAEVCSVENCKITCTGEYGIEINKGCRNVHIKNCQFVNCGGGGIKIIGTPAEGDDDIRPTSYCTIRKNTIQNCGLRWASSAGVLVCHSAHNEISENEISYLEYTGISVGWVWGYKPSSTYGNIIKNNHIHHIGSGRLSDMGGIYILGMQHGTVISGNIIHDVKSGDYGGQGIYTDEGSSYVTIENNTVFRCDSSCYQHHYGKQNVLRGNIFAFAGSSIIEISKAESHCSVLAQENVFITEGSPIYHMSPGQAITTELAASNNIIWDVSGNEPTMFRSNTDEIKFSEWQEYYGYDIGSRVQEPDKELLEVLQANYGT